MIKLFRNIRKALLSDGKTTKYFKYAFGEIVLVVIGILIALQINNWNEDRKSQKVEYTYLKNIHRDLKEQLASLEVQLEYEKEFCMATSKIKSDYAKNSSLIIDSTFYINATIVTSRKTFVITDPTFRDLISSGNLNVIKDDVFKDELIKYYQELERVEQIIHNNNTILVDQNYFPVFQKMGYYHRNLATSSNTFGVNDTSVAFNLKFNEKLQKISNEILSKQENELQFVNAINSRHSIALSHYVVLQKLKNATAKLILNKNLLLKND
ncbi:DUF6090 family protein [Polaribacter sp.]|uniref:DUF6090 family protein n=1 Tax=Polaribacter sp. TaxID=1920175 RepID=UPI00404780AF